ncbi:hypothetical protein PMIN06_001684 [Paraphaeosphaeria minitans]|uniref:Cytidylyltransferase family protein n=1 Tax=Paraphaeosphaeria minitans TaxID=565426 RepID=A0A9P6GQS4_9PLEO|nr:cytidylyltransferase family protein [Paraphaeosphaeria minitans]
MDDMSTRVSTLRSLLPSIQSSLETFNASPSKFHVVRTINPSPTQPRTLYILDSSFNPPSRAHLSLATSALNIQKPGEDKPARLLLLFSTHNADKAPSPASFVQRIALMTVFAEDVLRSLQSSSATPEDTKNVSIDIGLTKEPYYTDKSVAIAAEAPEIYASEPIHVHLVGYDTLIRFCNPKYYAEYKPPLSALKPFFDAGHKLRVTQRPCNENDPSSKEFGTVEDQEKYLQNIKDGDLEKDGFEREWRGNIDMVEGTGMGISSTRVRREAKYGNWDEVGRLCTEGVAAWIRGEGLYEGDASGKKMG